MSSDTTELARALGSALAQRGMRLATAESCTGGRIAGAVTDIAGSSGWFDRGFVTYSNEAKCEMLGVAATTISAHGAVSEQTAREMAEGALRHSLADVSIAVTGIAGPGGATLTKAVGTVCFAWARRNRPTRSETLVFSGDREAVRAQSVAHGMHGLLAGLVSDQS